MAEIEHLGTQDHYPLINFAKKDMWGNPSGDLQFQVRLKRVSHELGYMGNFEYMGKYYLCPDNVHFWNVFTMGFLNPGNMNLGYRMLNWVPFNRWVNAAELMKARGVFLDFYNGAGLRYNSANTWIMRCFNGTTLIAFSKNVAVYPMPVEKSMYMHCYSPDAVMYTSEGYPDENAAYLTNGIIFSDYRDWDQMKTWYNAAVAKNKGRVLAFHNGYLVDFSTIVPSVGDLIECVYDPTIFQRLTYKYTTLNNYYSEQDKKRKLILFPWLNNPKRRYYYFDDCRYYIYNTRLKRGIYYHRNSQDAVRQLTHQDYALAADYVDSLVDRLISEDETNKTTKNDIVVMIDYVTTNWVNYLGPNTSRIADLYLLEDPTKIINAMTGVNTTVPFWEGRNLERSPHKKLLGMEYTDITNNDVYEALGYNGCSQVLSQPFNYMPGVLPTDPSFKNIYPTAQLMSGEGYLVPPSCRISGTVYEYDSKGYLLRLVPISNRERYLPNKDVYFCEFMVGEATTYLDATLTKTNTIVESNHSFRVYRAPWKIGDDAVDPVGFWGHEWTISKDGLPFLNTNTVVSIPESDPADEPLNPRPWDGGEIAGDWEDITDTDLYTFDKVTGLITWNFSMVNYIGMVVRDSKHLYNEMKVSHLDHSVNFTLNHLWEVGGYVLPIRPYQLEVFYKERTLIENVDYIFDFPTVYVMGKELLDDGNDHLFRFRAVGLSKDGPYNRSELGFVTNGVIGYNGRYNVRINRPTKFVCHGHAMLTRSVDWAETKGHGNNLNGMEGMPYEVLHYACINKYVEPYNTMKGIDEDVKRDELVSAYLTTNATYKPKIPPKLPTQTSKYILFSPFLSQLYNELNLGFKKTPTGTLSNQDIYDITADIQWLLKYDPILNEFDPAYFEVHPCVNFGYQPITAQQLTILNMANDLFLKGSVQIRGHFEVKPNE